MWFKSFILQMQKENVSLAGRCRKNMAAETWLQPSGIWSLCSHRDITLLGEGIWHILYGASKVWWYFLNLESIACLRISHSFLWSELSSECKLSLKVIKLLILRTSSFGLEMYIALQNQVTSLNLLGTKSNRDTLQTEIFNLKISDLYIFFCVSNFVQNFVKWAYLHLAVINVRTMKPAYSKGKGKGTKISFMRWTVWGMTYFCVCVSNSVQNFVKWAYLHLEVINDRSMTLAYCKGKGKSAEISFMGWTFGRMLVIH